MDVNNNKWLANNFGADIDTIVEALKMSPSSQGYIYGALSEIFLTRYLEKNGFEVLRIKEKPAGGFDEKKVGYKGDFLIKKHGTEEYYVVECKGLKSNSEFRSAQTEDNHIKQLSYEQAYNVLKKYIAIDKERIYNRGLASYKRVKEAWERENHKVFPEFRWDKRWPGPDNADLSECFGSVEELHDFVFNSDSRLLSENSFRNKKGLYKILQTHEPSDRTDECTGIHQAAPLVSDFSIMAVDLYLRTGKHEFVFMNPREISHSPSSPNHLYQNYIIDIIIPGKKDDLKIKRPWYSDIEECIRLTHPVTVEYDESQLDFRQEAGEE